MAEHENLGNGENNSTADAGGNDSIAKLMRLAGPRPAVPGEVRERVHAAVKKEWRSKFRQRRTRFWGIPLALAAAVVAAVLLTARAPELAVAPIATVALVSGDAGAGAGRLSPGDSIYPGDLVATGKRGMALAVSNGFSLRLAASTTLKFDGMEDLTLLSGRLYADTGQAIYDNRSITVHTSVGSARDIGTQFAVEFLGDAMHVAVREGSVDVSNQRSSYTAKAGETLTLDTNDEVNVGRLAVNDNAWDWVAELTPAFDIENRTLLEFLQWAARETGRELVFENESVRMAAMGTRLHGSVRDFTPIEAVDSVMPTTKFEYNVDSNRIVIGDASQ